MSPADWAIRIAFNVDEHSIGVVLLGDNQDLRAGAEVTRTGRVTDVPVGMALLGRVIDPLGRPLDRDEPIQAAMHLPIERPAPSIIDRDLVAQPLRLVAAVCVLEE